MIVSKHNNVSRLTFISEEPSKNGHKMNKYLCDCGNYYVCRETGYKTGNTLSCGCMSNEIRKINLRMRDIEGASLNGKTTPEYQVYAHMKSRCYGKYDHKYKNYGGRGIVVCERWLKSFKYFLEDMGRRPSSRHSIDRINVNGNYEPSNCRWALPDVQSSNKTNTVYITFNDERIHQAEFARRVGVTPHSIEYYIKKGKTGAEIFNHFNNKNNAIAI